MSKKIIICITILLFSGFMYAKGAFVEVGDPSFFPNDFTYLVSMQIDNNGNIYAAYIQDDYYFSVAKFDGEKWSNVGEQKFSGGIGNVPETPDVWPYVSFTLSNDGIPFVSFPEAQNYSLNVMKFDSGSGKWEYVGKSNITDYKTNYTSIAVDSEGVPYVVFNGCTTDDCKRTDEDFGNYTIDTPIIMKYENGSWEYVGEQMLLFENTPSKDSSSNNKIILDSSNTPVVAFSDGREGVCIMKFDGTGWEMVGDIYEIEIMSTGVLFIDREDNLYFNCYWGNDFSDPWVLEFDGEKWDKKFSSKNMGLINFNSENIPYAILSDWIEENSLISVSLGKYINKNWDIIDSFELEYSNSLGLAMKLDKNDVPFFAYVNNNQQVELLKYDPEDDEPPNDSDEETVSDEDSVPVNDKDSGSSGCGIIVI